MMIIMSKKPDYALWGKEELIKEIDSLRKQKTYGLVWEQDKTKEIFDYYINWEGEKTKEKFGLTNKFPILKSIKSKDIISDTDQNSNILIEGDNYHSLAVLNFTHSQAIDVVYIDPPYNTGEKDFKYNDIWIDTEDTFKHSKWLSFMSKRLLLAKNLLKKDGVIIVHIDEHEQANLHILMNEIYGENNFLGTIIWDKKNPKGDAQGVAYQHELIIVYAKNKPEFLKSRDLSRPKPDAKLILKKAAELYSKLNAVDYPEDLKDISKKYKLPDEVINKYFRADNFNQFFRFIRVSSMVTFI